MNNLSKEANPVDHITRKDLDEVLDRHTASIKEHIGHIKKEIDLKMDPIIKEQAEVRLILTGPSKLNGLIGRMKTLSTNLKIIYVLLAVVGGFLAKLFIKLL